METVHTFMHKDTWYEQAVDSRSADLLAKWFENRAMGYWRRGWLIRQKYLTFWQAIRHPCLTRSRRNYVADLNFIAKRYDECAIRAHGMADEFVRHGLTFPRDYIFKIESPVRVHNRKCLKQCRFRGSMVAARSARSEPYTW